MVELVKYPRTPHLPFSPGATSDDKFISNNGLSHLQSGIELIVTEKMDGGNLTFYKDNFHARSLSSGTQPWDTLARKVWSEVRFDIPAGWRVCGESLYARRSVSYDNLPGPFMVFGIWNDENVLLSWDDMVEWCSLLELPHVPLLYKGFSFEQASKVWFSGFDVDISEGFVVRNADSFHYSDFALNVGKWVRENHVRTEADWRKRDDFQINTFNV